LVQGIFHNLYKFWLIAIIFMKLFFRYLQELGILVFSMALDVQGHNQRWYSFFPFSFTIFVNFFSQRLLVMLLCI